MRRKNFKNRELQSPCFSFLKRMRLMLRILGLAWTVVNEQHRLKEYNLRRKGLNIDNLESGSARGRLKAAHTFE